MTEVSPKPQSLKKWVLLLFSVVAVVIWVRNFLILIPTRDSALSAESNAAGVVPLPNSIVPVWPSNFDDSGKWEDPFAPQKAKRESIHPDSASLQRRSPPKPPPEPPPWRLTGIVWDKKAPAATLTSITDSRRVVVAKGDTLDSARIEKIDQGNVWIRHGGKSWKLALNNNDTVQAQR